MMQSWALNNLEGMFYADTKNYIKLKNVIVRRKQTYDSPNREL